MKGIHRTTGKALSGVDHLRQSITDILTTPIGTRVLRRDYGSRLYELVDAPINRSLFIEIYAATAEALILWEPRFELIRVQVERIDVGELEINVEGRIVHTGEAIILDGLVI